MTSPIYFLYPNIATSPDVRYLGPTETAAAFRDAVDWDSVVSHADVLGAYVNSVTETPTGTDGFIPNLIAMADRHSKALAFEPAGPYGTVSYATGADSAQWDIDHAIAYVEALGGAWTYLLMDSGLSRVIDGLGGSIADSVAQIVEYMQTIHAARPGIQIGLVTQPTNWEYGGVTRYPPTPYGYDLSDALDALFTAVDTAGETLAFVHLDIEHDYSNGLVYSANKDADHWLTRCAAIQTKVKAAGIAFGMNIGSSIGGGGSDGTFPGESPGTDERFQQRSLRFAAQLREMIAAGRMDPLDHVNVQSFWYYPRDLAPETTPYTFADTFIKARAIMESDRYKAWL